MISAPANFLTANAVIAKQPIYLIQIAGYSRAFINYDMGVSGQFTWIKASSLEDLTTTVSDLDGSADLQEFKFTVLDFQNLLTADFPGFTFEGKAITLKTGMVGMAQVDFATLFTGKIDSVASTDSNNAYLFTCTDRKQELAKLIFRTGTSGLPTDSKNPRLVNGHPLDILINILEVELGVLSTDIGLAKIISYRDGPYSGIQFTFNITSPPVAKDFIEQELLKPLGAYIWVNNLGQFTINFFYPTTFTALANFNPANLKSIPEAGQADLINQVSVRFDLSADTGKFLGESIIEDPASVAKYGLFGQRVIESAGLRSSFMGFYLASFLTHLIFLRYGYKTLMFDGKIEAIWSMCLLDPGDFVTVTHSQIPDRLAGIMGITALNFEVMDRTWNFTEGVVTYKFLYINLTAFKQYLITPNNEPNYTAATTLDKGKYMFMDNNSDQYSNGAPGNTLG